MNLRRNRMIRVVLARPRLFIATAFGLALGVGLPQSIASHPATRFLLAWNAATALYVVLAAVMMARSSESRMQRRAQLQDDGQIVILLLVVLSGFASLAAIAGQLAMVKDMHGSLRDLHIALAGLTVLTSWAFIQTMFALHYAHDYYAAACHGRKPGLQFPGEEPPDYGDFFYFAAVIGTSGQTADVSFTNRTLRRVGTVHCMVAYLFNTTVLALLINIGASLL